MFFAAAQALMGAGVVHVEGGQNRAQTMPFSYPFRASFVPGSCLARLAADRSRSLATSRRSSFVAIVIAWSLYHSPPRCAGGNWRRNGFLGHAVFEWDEREKLLDFL